MRFGVHLPQYGRAAGAEAIRRAALQAEQLGLEDVWVSDHQVIPEGLAYPPAFLFEPLTALTWAAAATRRVGLGTSVMILPQYATVHLANTVASLDQLSGGRVTLGVGAGWLEPEFRALGARFSERGARLDESLDALRACWTQDPIRFKGRWHDLDGVRLQPQPAHHIPIWIGGASEAAYRRAVARGDGFHATRVSPELLRGVVERLRRERPEPEFAISVRADWDGLRDDPDALRAQLDGFGAAGVQHLVAVPAQRTLDDWLRSVERLAALFAAHRG
jgi:probable F420-dependent oxidoreductase